TIRRGGKPQAGQPAAVRGPAPDGRYPCFLWSVFQHTAMRHAASHISFLPATAPHCRPYLSLVAPLRYHRIQPDSPLTAFTPLHGRLCQDSPSGSSFVMGSYFHPATNVPSGRRLSCQSVSSWRPCYAPWALRSARAALTKSFPSFVNRWER